MLCNGKWYHSQCIFWIRGLEKQFWDSYVEDVLFVLQWLYLLLYSECVVSRHLSFEFTVTICSIALLGFDFLLNSASCFCSGVVHLRWCVATWMRCSILGEQTYWNCVSMWVSFCVDFYSFKGQLIILGVSIFNGVMGIFIKKL